jgi:hypothetical protein
MFDLATPTNGCHAHIVWWVGEDQDGRRIPHKFAHISCIPGVTAKDAMLAKNPQIAWTANGYSANLGQLVGRILLWIHEIAHERINFSRLETYNFKIETCWFQEWGEVIQLTSKCSAIPTGPFGNFVIGEDICAFLGFGQACD